MIFAEQPAAKNPQQNQKPKQTPKQIGALQIPIDFISVTWLNSLWDPVTLLWERMTSAVLFPVSMGSRDGWAGGAVHGEGADIL